MCGECGTVGNRLHFFFVCYTVISNSVNNLVDNVLLNNCFSQNYDLFSVYCVETDMKVSVSVYRLSISALSQQSYALCHQNSSVINFRCSINVSLFTLSHPCVVDKLSTRPKPLTSFTADWLEVHVNPGLVQCTHCLT